MKPFNLKLAQMGDPVCTRTGRKAKILDFSFNAGILYKTKGPDGEEWTYEVGPDGRIGENDTDYDLFMEDKIAYCNVFISEGQLYTGQIFPTMGDCDIELLNTKYQSLKYFSRAKLIFIDEDGNKRNGL